MTSAGNDRRWPLCASLVRGSARYVSASAAAGGGGGGGCVGPSAARSMDVCSPTPAACAAGRNERPRLASTMCPPWVYARDGLPDPVKYDDVTRCCRVSP